MSRLESATPLIAALLWPAVVLLLGCGSEVPVPEDYVDPIPWPPPGYA